MSSLRFLAIGASLACALSLSACALLPVTVVKTVPLPEGDQAPTCAGVDVVGAVLRGDPQDPDVAWAEPEKGGARIPILWPPGYTATFDSRLEVHDSTGRVVAEDGSPLPDALEEMGLAVCTKPTEFRVIDSDGT